MAVSQGAVVNKDTEYDYPRYGEVVGRQSKSKFPGHRWSYPASHGMHKGAEEEFLLTHKRQACGRGMLEEALLLLKYPVYGCRSLIVTREFSLT